MAAITQADLDALERAIALGARTVAFDDGKRVTYHSIAEMREAYEFARACLAGTPGVVRKVISPGRGIESGGGGPYDPWSRCY